MEVKASNPKTEQEAVVEYDFGATVDEAVELFGADVVHDYFVGQAKVRLQAGLRACMEQGRDPVDYAKQWKPGVKAPSILTDPMAAATAAFGRMDEAQRREFLEKLSA